MKSFLQNLLIVFSLCMCVLLAIQWHREAKLRADSQTLHDTIYGKKEQIQGLEGSLKHAEDEIQRLTGIKETLTEMVKSNRLEIAKYQKDLEKADLEIEKNLRAIDTYKAALEQANENIKQQNETVKTQNEQLTKLAGERNEFVSKYNEVVQQFNDLIKKWNEQQAILATNAPAKK